VKRKKKACRLFFFFHFRLTHTHTRHNFDSLTAYYLMMLLLLQPLWMTLLAWQNLLPSRLWFRAQNTEISYYKNQNTFEKKTSSMPVIFIYRTNFHFSWFVYFFHYLMCRHEQNTQTKFPPPPPTLHVSWKGREESNRDVRDSPLNATTLTCLVFVDNSKTRNWASARHDCLVPRFFLFIFLPLFSTHTHTKAWKSSLTIFARPFLVLLSFLWTFSNNRKDQKTLQKKNAQTKTHLLYTTTTTTSLSNLVAAFLYYYFIFSLLKRFHPQTNILRLFFSLSHTHTHERLVR
jgi:hypothetical protein